MRIAMCVVGALLIAGLAAAQPPGTPAADEDLLGPSPWHDSVHYFGVAAALLALAAVSAGAVLYFGHNLPRHPYHSPARRRTRWIHMLTGATAITCGAIHFAGRLSQLGDYSLALSPPYLAMYLFALVLLSGILRNWTPAGMRKQWWLFAWLHRAAVVGALYELTRHTLYQYHKFTGR